MAQITDALYGLVLLALICTALILIERLAPIEKKQPAFRRDTLTDLCYLPLNMLVLAAMLTAALAPFALLFELSVFSHLRASVAAQPFWLQFLEIAFLSDLGLYAGHRLLHTVSWLWKFHSIHHSARELDWMTAFRNHPIDLLVMRFSMFLPLVALQFDAGVQGAYFLYYGLQTAFVHANLRVNLGRFSIFYAGPEFHRWHHADLPEAKDKNFGSVFPWIDWCFGTYYAPSRFPQSYGTDEPVPRSFIRQLFYPVQGLQHNLTAVASTVRDRD